MSSLFSVIVFLFSFGVNAQIKPPASKVLIFYSSVGMGHLSAARAIEQSIKIQEPAAEVVLKNVKDFEQPQKQKFRTWAYWFIVKNYPDLFDKMFRAAMKSGSLAKRLSDIGSAYEYDHGAALRYISGINPTSIVATHYGSALLLRNLREKGYFRNVPMAWLHTDYFKGYFPRISKSLDMTFVGMQQVRDLWVDEGVDPSRVQSTGIPVSAAVFTPIDRVQFMKDKDLNPDIKTVTIATGGEGVGDFEKIVKSLAATVPEPLQIIAICAKSEENYNKLTKLKETLPPHITLHIHKMVPNADLLSYVKISDAYITKSGGLSPTEGFAITRPMVLLDIYGGHERDNAALFEKEGLALINRDQTKIGLDVKRLFTDETLRAQMLTAQLSFRNAINLDAIGAFAIKNRQSNVMPTFQLGLQGGDEALLTDEALAKLEHDSPSDIEVILSYGKSLDGSYVKKNNDGNPFGHLAVRVGHTVYTVNGRAKRGVETNLVHQASLRDYLYSSVRPYQNVEHTDAFGSSYGRDNISVRVHGLTTEALQLMAAEVDRIDHEFREGKTSWHKTQDNCADFVVRILRAGGIDSPEMQKFQNPKHVTLPADVYETYKEYFASQKNLSTEVVFYSQVADSQSLYTSTRYPLSFYRMKRALKSLIFKNVAIEEEKEVTKRISFYSGDRRAYYENLDGQTHEQTVKASADELAKQQAQMETLQRLETQLGEAHRDLQTSTDSVRDLAGNINAALSQLSTENLQLLKSGRTEVIRDPVQRGRANALLKRLKAWDQIQATYQSLNDKFIQAELDYFIDGSKTVLEAAYAQGKSSAALTKKLQASYNEATQQYELYVASRQQYGRPKDGPTRTSSYRAFFNAAKSFMDQLSASPEDKSPEFKGFWADVKIRSSRVYGLLKLIVTLTPKATSLLVNLMLNPVSPPGEAPINDSIHGLFRELATQMNVKVEVANRERLSTPHELSSDKVINIVAPTHRDPILDGLLMAHLGVDRSLLVLAGDQFAPKAIADRMDRSDSIIMVGRGSDLPVAKILGQLQRNKTNTILIYPEGSVAAGLAETRPVREKFSWGLVQRLIESGYKVNLIPVTYENSGRFTYESGKINTQGSSDTLTAQVHQPVNSDTLELLARAGGSEAIGRYLRAAWMDGLGITDQTIHGLIRPEIVSQRLATEARLPVRYQTASPQLRPRLQCPSVLLDSASSF